MAEMADVEKIQALMEVYKSATEISCRMIDNQGIVLRSYDIPAHRGFCELAHKSLDGAQQCRQSYLYGALQAEKLGDAYIHFCPYGLVNWTVPVLNGEELQCSLVGGPVLMHPVDDLLIEDIITKNRGLASERGELHSVLTDIPFADTTRTRHLADLLMRLVKGVSVGGVLESRQEMNVFTAKIADSIHQLKKAENQDSREDNQMMFKQEKQLISKVRIGDQQTARELLNEILGHIFFYDTDFDLVKAKVIDVLAVLARAAIEAGADLEIVFGLRYAYFVRMGTVNNIHELSELLIRVLDRFMECAFSLKNLKNRDLIFRAMDYIRKHYAENITLEQVADDVGLNPNYFSKLFKEETQMSYKDYVNRVRIEAGKQLLLQGNPLAEVSQLLGYNDQSYFSKVFKKTTGVTPLQWKRSYGGSTN